MPFLRDRPPEVPFAQVLSEDRFVEELEFRDYILGLSFDSVVPEGAAKSG